MALDKDALATSGSRSLLEASDDWNWGTGRYAEYRQIPSRNGYYLPSDEHHVIWPAIRGFHFESIRKAADQSTMDPRTSKRYTPAILQYLRNELGRENRTPSIETMSSEHETSPSQQDLEALETFVVDNKDLDRLEALLDRFNILEALGVVSQELRHSDFLAFLMDPRGNHDLEDAFVKRLLQRALMSAGDVARSVTPIEIELWNLDRVEIRKEWQRIDILLLDEDNEPAIIIENKIGTGEHSNQLQRYWETIQQHYPGWRAIGVFLTPDGTPPSHAAYLSMDYGSVSEVIDDLAENRASVLKPDVKTLMNHCTDMLRRNIVGDSEIARLSRQIYQKHKRALDIIYEHLPDVQTELESVLSSLIEEEPEVELDDSSKSKIRFAIPAWDTPELLSAQGWTSSGRILLFEFWNYPGSLELKLYIGPAPNEIRTELLELARAHPDVFSVPRRASTRWTPIFTRRDLREEDYEEATDSDREKQIRHHWSKFLDEDLPRMDAVLREDEWI